MWQVETYGLLMNLFPYGGVRQHTLDKSPNKCSGKYCLTR